MDRSNPTPVLVYRTENQGACVWGVRLVDGSLAARAAGEVVHATKSHHHQGVDVIGDGLEVTGWASIDDLPEAIEDPSRRFALGVQWHPEADPVGAEIAALVEAARAEVCSR